MRIEKKTEKKKRHRMVVVIGCDLRGRRTGRDTTQQPGWQGKFAPHVLTCIDFNFREKDDDEDENE
jgi:hypothetical protein